MTTPRSPQHDSLPASDPVWETVPLGPGQEPGMQGEGDFQFTRDGDAIARTDTRRTPGRDHGFVVHRPPHSPA